MVFFRVITALHRNTLSLMLAQHVSWAAQYTMLTDVILPSSSCDQSLFEIWQIYGNLEEVENCH
jgi:hypothetical protein